MAGLKTYKCPECGGPLEWNAGVQKMKCPYCDSEFTVEALEAIIGTKEEDKAEEEAAAAKEEAAQASGSQTSASEGVESNFDSVSWEDNHEYFSESETAGMKIYGCDSCGAQIIAPETQGSMTCPYCNNNVVMVGQFAGDLKPDYIIPFKLDKEAAKAALKRHVSSRKFVPKIFSEKNHIDEIKAIYVPYWLFSASADVNATFNATKIKTRRRGRTEYTDTEHYVLERGGTMDFEHVPADASRNIADDLMESIEPFDFKDAVPFNAAYLAGFLADRYDVTMDECKQTAFSRMENSARTAFKGLNGGYSSVSPIRYHIDFKKGTTDYALYPVWILNTSWNGGKYLFAMNGQTGKFVGDLPLDKGAYYKRWALMAAVIGGIIYALMWAVALL